MQELQQSRQCWCKDCGCGGSAIIAVTASAQ
jgi:hypothetical protein